MRMRAMHDSAQCDRARMQADCLEEEEILQRKSELERLRANGLKVYSFPEDVVAKLTDAAHGLSQSDPLLGEPASTPGPAFRPPFNIVVGAHADLSVHRFWFVRKYRCAPACGVCTARVHARDERDGAQVGRVRGVPHEQLRPAAAAAAAAGGRLLVHQGRGGRALPQAAPRSETRGGGGCENNGDRHGRGGRADEWRGPGGPRCGRCWI
jgi:hypothetical protein